MHHCSTQHAPSACHRPDLALLMFGKKTPLCVVILGNLSVLQKRCQLCGLAPFATYIVLQMNSRLYKPLLK